MVGIASEQAAVGEEHDLDIASRMRSEQSDEPSAEQIEEVDHLGAKLAHCCICATPDDIFGRYTCPSFITAERLVTIRPRLRQQRTLPSSW
jgi:(p)ppGpp synthase/HD superfamily hydrolase